MFIVFVFLLPRVLKGFFLSLQVESTRSFSFRRVSLWLPALALLLCVSPPAPVFAGISGHPSSVDSELRKEIELGKSVATEIEGHWNRIVDPSKIAHLSMIAERLVPHLTRSLPYEVRLIDEESPNAFALPGGIVFITTGMTEFVRSDHELAAILAHEFVHADRRHGMIQVARNERLTLLSLVVAIASRGQGAALLMAGLAQVAVMNSYSRDLEEEADREGLAILFLSGYDPSGMVTLMERLSEETLKRPHVDQGIYQSHPDEEARVLYLIETMRDNGWKLQRKVPLRLLRPKWYTAEGYSSLYLDETLIWSVPEGVLTEEERYSLADVLERSIQLELPPYEIRVLEEGDTAVLMVGFSPFLREPLPKGADSLSQVRERLLQALQKAQGTHPLGNYLR